MSYTTTLQYKIGHDEDLSNLLRNPNIAAFIKSKIIQWLGHV